VKCSLGEFWSLVYDYECSAVVILAVPDPGVVSVRTRFQYFPAYCFFKESFICCINTLENEKADLVAPIFLFFFVESLTLLLYYALQQQIRNQLIKYL